MWFCWLQCLGFTSAWIVYVVVGVCCLYLFCVAMLWGVWYCWFSGWHLGCFCWFVGVLLAVVMMCWDWLGCGFIGWFVYCVGWYLLVHVPIVFLIVVVLVVAFGFVFTIKTLICACLVFWLLWVDVWCLLNLLMVWFVTCSFCCVLVLVWLLLLYYLLTCWFGVFYWLLISCCFLL